MPRIMSGIPQMGGTDGITIPEMPGSAQAGQTQGVDFAKALGNAVAQAGNAERAADDAGQKFAAGDPSVGIHEVMIASEKANISVKYAVNVKNKLIEAYKELLNTPL
jgi:flagellar hook-basal body complex protein FliE